MTDKADETAATPRHIADDCPCLNKRCAMHGDCVRCVAAHRQHRKHIPECMEDIIRDSVKGLAELVEYRVEDARPVVKQE